MFTKLREKIKEITESSDLSYEEVFKLLRTYYLFMMSVSEYLQSLSDEIINAIQQSFKKNSLNFSPPVLKKFVPSEEYETNSCTIRKISTELNNFIDKLECDTFENTRESYIKLTKNIIDVDELLNMIIKSNKNDTIIYQNN